MKSSLIKIVGEEHQQWRSGTSLGSFASLLLTALGLPTPATGEVGTPSAAINTWGTIAGGGYADGTSDNTDPKAFVTIVLFDKNYNFLDVAYAQLKGTSLYYMTASYTVKEAGYAYLYVSNEQAAQTDVYFDDVTMTYTPTQVIQNNEYYPFGLQTAESWTRSGTTNNFLYDQGSEVNTTTGYYDLPYRNYDPALGRFFQVDRFSIYDHDMTPYHYSRNNSIKYNDPTGLTEEYEGNEEEGSASAEEQENTMFLDAGGGIGDGDGADGNPSSDSDNEFTVSQTTYEENEMDNESRYDAICPDCPKENQGNFICTTCPQNDPRFQPFIDDPFNIFNYDPKTGLVTNSTGTTSWGWDPQLGGWLIQGTQQLQTVTINGNTQSSEDGQYLFSGVNLDITGPTLILLGQETIPKPFVMSGATKGTSVASVVLRKAVPQTFTKVLGKTAGTKVATTLGTNVIGGALGRSVPYIGWGMTIYDVIDNWDIIEAFLGAVKEDNENNHYPSH
jgi:RHS repeat-associated protein